MPITIELDRGQGLYKGGDLIIGKVIVINSSEKSRQLNNGMKGRCWNKFHPTDYRKVINYLSADLIPADLTITFVGKAWTQWKEGRSKRDGIRQYLISKWEIETYFNQSFLLLQPGNSNFKVIQRILRKEMFKMSLFWPLNFYHN